MASIKTSKGIYYYTPNIIFLGCKMIDKEIALENLRILAPILDKAEITWGPAFGTLLGIYRDGDFISWDEDTDLYILEEDISKLFDLLFDLRSIGFELLRVERGGIYSIGRNGEYIDFNVMKTIGDGVRGMNCTYFFLDKYFKERQQILFKGINLSIPSDIDEYLTMLYGDWRTPVKSYNYEQSKLHIFLDKIKIWIKSSMPSRLYFYLLRKHHEPQFQKFIAKCKSMGISLPKDLSTSAYR